MRISHHEKLNNVPVIMPNDPFSDLPDFFPPLFFRVLESSRNVGFNTVNNPRKEEFTMKSHI